MELDSHGRRGCAGIQEEHKNDDPKTSLRRLIFLGWAVVVIIANTPFHCN